jgi:hypothetical protein
MRCPVCRADNDGATCRRCRADLAPLLELEAERARCLSRAAAAVLRGDGAAAVAEAEGAEHLRTGRDALQLLAVGFLLQRDFRRALEARARWQRFE